MEGDEEEEGAVTGRLTLVPSIARPSPPPPCLVWPGEGHKVGSEGETLQSRSWEDAPIAPPPSRVSRTWRSNSLYPISPQHLMMGTVEKVSRSSSLTTTTLKDSVIAMDTLKLPDARRLSFASDGSAVSSASSLSDFWPGESGERRSSPFGQAASYADSTKGGEARGGGDFPRRISNESDGSYFGTDLLEVERKQDFDRRSSGIGSDFEGTPSGLSYSYSDRHPSRLSVDSVYYDRRSSSQSNYSDRRSSCESKDAHQHNQLPSTGGLKSPSLFSCQPPLVEYLTPNSSPTFPSHPPVQPGMRGVPEWLKSLRLHKYTHIVMSLSYRELLALNEQQLEKMGVTKGARRKIAASVTRLCERPRILGEIDREVDEGRADLKRLLSELEGVLRCPITSEEQVSGIMDGSAIVGLIMTSLRKVCSSLLLAPSTDPKTMAIFSGLLDLCLSNEAYSTQEKQLLVSWQQKIVTIWGPLPAPSQEPHQKPSHFWQFPPSFRRYSLQNRDPRYSSLPWSCPRPPGPEPLPLLQASQLVYQPRPTSFQQRRSVPNIKFSMARRASHEDLSLDFPLYSFPPPDIPPHNLSLREVRGSPMSRSTEPPLVPPPQLVDVSWTQRQEEVIGEKHFSTEGSDPNGSQLETREVDSDMERELDSRLKSLCLSVTEHALSSEN